MNNDNLIQHAMFGNLAELNIDDALRSRCAAAANLMNDIRSQHDTVSATITGSYLPAAAESERGKLRQASRERLDRATQQLVADLTRREQDLRLRLAPKPGGDDKTALVLEARAALFKIDALDREAILIEASRTGDTITQSAFQTAPLWMCDERGLPLASNEMLTKCRTIAAVAAAPEISRELDAVVAARTSLESAIASCERYCECRVDTVARMAGDPTALA